MKKNRFTPYCNMLFLCWALLQLALPAHGKKARVLFIGNSYTYVNNLPKIIADMASSTGDTLEYDVSAPGGATFNQHAMFIPATMTKIKAGGWDYVVLQEQSQVPATTMPYFDYWVYRFAKVLMDSIRHYNPCATPLFYMTWGRKNGDMTRCPSPVYWRVFCTYHTMDSVIRERYMLMADSFASAVSPVGAVWRYIRNRHAGIELYDADESHPSPAGSYAGACSFYTAIFGKPADSIRFDFSLPVATAATIRSVATKVVYDSMAFWHIGQYEIRAGFSHDAGGMSPVNFTNTSLHATSYAWDFGDGTTSTAANPTHTYTAPGTYTVRLVATGARDCSDTIYTTFTLSAVGIADPALAQLSITPNPSDGRFTIKLQEAYHSEALLNVYDMMGRMVYTAQVAAYTASVDLQLQHLPKGMYNLILYSGKGVTNSKLMIR